MGIEDGRKDSTPGLDLESLEFKPLRLANADEREITYNEEPLEILFKGIPLKINVRNESYFKTVSQYFYGTTVIKVSTKTINDIATVSILTRENPDGTYKASTSVRNESREISELGRALWKISLQLIQKISDQLNVPITHEVVKMQEEGLNSEKWDELFTPLLSEYRYVKNTSKYNSIYPDLYEKTYLPK